MKYSKSAFPYLTLLFVLLLAIPFRSYQLEVEQTISVKVQAVENEDLLSAPQYVENLTFKGQQ
ncbi:MAG: hypothetical protein HRU41_40450 [Saprospiraceae bacterium]|nr:hypothetical protein [Saprospiraceae bacterium]